MDREPFPLLVPGGLVADRTSSGSGKPCGSKILGGSIVTQFTVKGSAIADVVILEPVNLTAMYFQLWR